MYIVYICMYTYKYIACIHSCTTFMLFKFNFKCSFMDISFGVAKIV